MILEGWKQIPVFFLSFGYIGNMREKIKLNVEPTNDAN
jgi:hypothetical protein